MTGETMPSLFPEGALPVAVVLPRDEFDYGALLGRDPDHLQKRAERIRDLTCDKRAAEREVGHLLIEARAEIGDDGTFVRWIVEATGLSVSTAYRYIALVEKLGDRFLMLGSVPITVLHKLAENWVPGWFRDEIAERAKSGEVLTPKAVDDEMKVRLMAKPIRLSAKTQAARRADPTPERRVDAGAEHNQDEPHRAAEAAKVEARLREERHANELREQERAAPGVALLLRKVGVDDLASLAEHYGPELGKVMSLAAELAVAQRAREGVEDKVPVESIERAGGAPLDPWPPARIPEAIVETADRIKAGRPVEPILVTKVKDGLYRVVDGAMTFRAYADALKRSEVPVRVAPPVGPIGAAALAATAQAPIVLPSAPGTPKRRLNWRERKLMKRMPKNGVMKRRAAGAHAAGP